MQGVQLPPRKVTKDNTRPSTGKQVSVASEALNHSKVGNLKYRDVVGMSRDMALSFVVNGDNPLFPAKAVTCEFRYNEWKERK